MTFDNVPWVVTMKKNDHYFPMSEYAKDPSNPAGWRTASYRKRNDGAPVTADAMDEGAEESGGEEGPEDE